MKAVVIHAPGAPEQLVMADVAEPSPGPGEVLIDVAFAGCNWAIRKSAPASIRTLSRTRWCWVLRFPARSRSSVRT